MDDEAADLSVQLLVQLLLAIAVEILVLARRRNLNTFCVTLRQPLVADRPPSDAIRIIPAYRSSTR